MVAPREPPPGFLGLLEQLREEHMREVSALRAQVAYLEVQRATSAARPSGGWVSGSSAAVRRPPPHPNTAALEPEESADAAREEGTWTPAVPRVQTGAWEPSAHGEGLRVPVKSRTRSWDSKRKHTKKVIYGEEEKPHSRLEAFVRGAPFEIFFSCLIMCNVLVIAASMEYSGWVLGFEENLSPEMGTSPADALPGAEGFFEGVEWFCGIMFTAEIALKVAALHLRVLRDPWNWVDAAVVLIWAVDVSGASLGLNSQFARMVRLARLMRFMKLLRAVRGFDGLFIMTASLRGSLSSFGWACGLLVVCQMFMAIFLQQVLHLFYFQDDSVPEQDRREIYVYFGTFTRSLFSMFELTLANYPTVSRILAERVTQWFMLVTVLHKLTMGFAVVGVLNGVFMQETFKAASLDDKIMLRQKRRALEAHRQKMTKLFAAADQDGDGDITLEEFKEALSEPDIRVWLSSMELDASEDVEAVFALLDNNGNGLVNKDELIAGVLRVKGFARNIDMMKLSASVDTLKSMCAVALRGKPPTAPQQALCGTPLIAPQQSAEIVDM